MASIVATVATVVFAIARARPAHAPETASADSVEVLLLSTPQTAELSISARDLEVDGRRIARGRLHVQALGDSIVGSGGRRLEVASGGALTLTSGKRVRTLRGRLVLEARGGSLRIVARMASDEYLAGTLTAESGASDPAEYLAALSALQRNYLSTHRGRHAPDADLCDNTHCQLYHGTGVTARSHAIVRSARGLSLSAGDALPCYYSANCGGGSLTPLEVWGRSEDGYARVRCSDCRSSRWHRWTRRVPASTLAHSVFRSAPRAPFVDDDFKIRAGRALGFQTVPSNTVDRLERRGDHYLLAGRGFGHRVGLCQDGARRMALDGRSREEILRRYFPTATVSRALSTATDE